MMLTRVANRYYRQILKALNECEIKLVKRPRVGKEGVHAHYEDGVITIKQDNCNHVLCLIHEALHHIYPDMPEFESDRESPDLLSCELFCTFTTIQLDTLRKFLKEGE